MGNIKTASNGTTTNTYTYGNTTWRDQLTKFNGVTLIYDSSGNPTTYYNGTSWAMTWEQGRQLKRMVGGGKDISFSYDYTGLRTSKTIANGATYKYFYASGKLLRQTGNGITLDFVYDNAGRPYAMKYNGAWYYYILNLQGDVIHMVNSSGTLVASYEYDPYGKVISATSPNGSNIHTINPLRYRGYYYDTESGMYYLQSRYYDPAICRFINADSYASTGQGIIGCNMYAYCLNNPVIYRDSNGQVTTVCLDQETDSNTLPSRGASIGGAAAMALLVTVVASQVAQRMRMESTIAQKKAKAEMVSLPTESNKQLYSVYFLYEDGGSSSDIVYVGRVKTEYFNQRMTYHEKQGRLLAGAIQGLEYGTCRFLEQAGMIYHHCLISTNPLSNKIRGISPTNKNLYEYIAAAFDLACTDRYPDFSLLPLSYFENFVENEFLNLGS